MAHSFLKKFIPSYIYKTVYDINFQDIYNSGKKYMLVDIDNTLIPYDKYEADDKLKELFENINKIGFKLVLISNNHKPRVMHFASTLGYDYVYSAKKPLKLGMKKALKKLGKPKMNEVINLGDQIITDVFGAHRIKIDSILVKPIKRKSEHWYTKINRIMENIVLKKMKKHFNNKYQEIMEKIRFDEH